MPFLLVPILAQAVTVGVGDRTELRVAVSEDQTTPSAETRPFVSTQLAERNSDLTLTYSPTFLLTPLDDDPELVIFHTVSAVAAKRYRRTTIRLEENVGYGRTNFRVQALAGAAGITGLPTPGGFGGAAFPPGAGAPASGPPPTGGGTTAGGTASSGGVDRAATDRNITFATSRTQFGIVHRWTSRTTVFGGVGYDVSGQIGGTDRFYPLIHGPDATSALGYALSRRDQLTTTLNLDYVASDTGARFFSAGLSQGYTHQFNDYFQAGASAGLFFTRIENPDGTVTIALFPVSGLGSGAGIRYETRVGRGTLVLQAGATYSPVLDRVANVLDPRVGLNTGATYTLDRFMTYLNAGTTLSLTPNDDGALNSVGAAAGMAYELGAGFVLDGGLRAAWQTFEGAEVIPPSYAAFIGLSWGATVYQGR